MTSGCFQDTAPTAPAASTSSGTSTGAATTAVDGSTTLDDDASSTGFGSSSTGFETTSTGLDSTGTTTGGVDEPADPHCGCPMNADACLTFEEALPRGWVPEMDGFGQLPVPSEDPVVCGERSLRTNIPGQAPAESVSMLVSQPLKLQNLSAVTMEARVHVSAGCLQQPEGAFVRLFGVAFPDGKDGPSVLIAEVGVREGQVRLSFANESAGFNEDIAPLSIVPDEWMVMRLQFPVMQGAQGRLFVNDPEEPVAGAEIPPVSFSVGAAQISGIVGSRISVVSMNQCEIHYDDVWLELMP
ncbi:MAG: hypothetical protein AAGA54_21305 [Myxococcota bacterium]